MCRGRVARRGCARCCPPVRQVVRRGICSLACIPSSAAAIRRHQHGRPSDDDRDAGGRGPALPVTSSPTRRPAGSQKRHQQSRCSCDSPSLTFCLAIGSGRCSCGGEKRCQAVSFALCSLSIVVSALVRGLVCQSFCLSSLCLFRALCVGAVSCSVLFGLGLLGA